VGDDDHEALRSPRVGRRRAGLRGGVGHRPEPSATSSGTAVADPGNGQ
jgi:hypothetical protein